MENLILLHQGKIPKITCMQICENLLIYLVRYIKIPRIRKGTLMENQITQEQLASETARELLIRNITFCLNKCNDISLLDLILKLLKKSI